jgi:hypothetical protein
MDRAFCEPKGVSQDRDFGYKAKYSGSGIG